MTRILNEIEPHIIVQLAAVSHANRSNKDPYSTFDHSFRTLENALDYSKKNVRTNILKLDNGYFAAQPNNRMIVFDKSYSPKQLKFPDFKVSSIEYSVEDKHKITFGDDDEFFYGIKEEK